jgi:TorA maturation chaperone TorD
MSAGAAEPVTARAAAWRLLAGVIGEPPADAVVAALTGPALAATCAAARGDPLADTLRVMGAALGADGAVEAARSDATQLFLANRPLPVPPYESAWAGSREVGGERARAALRAYVEAGLVFDDWRARPADHVGLELAFVAELLVRGDCARAAEFVAAHVATWAEPMAARIRAHARTPFYRAAADALSELVGGVGVPAPAESS